MVPPKKIYLSPPHMCGSEQDYITQAFDKNWIAPVGNNIDVFENLLCNFIKEDTHVAALNSGTAAIHLGLLLLGVSKGDEVICQSLTFAASANPILYLGATPIFVDSERDTWNLSPDLLEIAIKDRIAKGKKPKAIIAVHLYGMPYKVNKIRNLADKYNIPILEDSAEALGSKYKGDKCGSFGDLGVFSFNGNKIITTSAGGALVAKNLETKNRAIYLATQARDMAPYYQHSEVGYNYRMSNILAGIGRGQMEVLENRVQSRRDIYDYYKDRLQNIPEIEFLDEPKDYFSNRWLSCILTSSFEIRERIRLALEKENIDSRTLWKPLHLQPIFQESPSFLDGTSEDIFQRGLCLPSGSNLTEEEQERVISIISYVTEKVLKLA
ncbi:Putative pyridoxal phosphate-dependent aminotransferase EpsN [Arenibacter antarcticus]